MVRDQLFAQPDFIPQFCQIEHFAGLRIGMTGNQGVLGRILAGRLQRHEISVEHYPGDITDGKAMSAWFSDRVFDLFFHFAAIVPLGTVNHDPVRAFEVNTLGAFQICKQLVQMNHPCWVFIASSSHVYQPLPASAWHPLKVGDTEAPKSVYGRTKLAAEHICRQFLETYQQSYCIGRIFSFSHSSQREPYLVPTLIRRIRELRNGQRLSLVNPGALRDIADAETVIDAILYLAHQRSQGTLNIGSGKPRTVGDIARYLAAKYGKELDIAGEITGTEDALVADIDPLRQIIISSHSCPE